MAELSQTPTDFVGNLNGATNSRRVYCVWYQFLFLSNPQHSPSDHQSFSSLYIFYFASLSFFPSPFVFLLYSPRIPHSFLPAVFLTFSPSVSVLDGKSELLEWNQPHFWLVCVCAHAWVNRAVKVRLIHWLQLRVVGWVSFLPVWSPPCDKCQQLGEVSVAPHRKAERIWPGFSPHSLSLIHQANFGQDSNPSTRAD